MICAKLHRNINVSNTCNARCIYIDCFIDHRNEDSVYNEACCLVHLYRSLANLRSDAFDLLYQIRGCVRTSNYLYQLHSVCRIKEVHTNQRTVQSCTHLSDWKGRSISGKDTLWLYNVLQFLEGWLLDFHLLRRNLNHKIAVCTDIFQSCSDLCCDCICLLLCDLFLANEEVQIL